MQSGCALRVSLFAPYGTTPQPAGRAWRYTVILPDQPALVDVVLAVQSVYSFPFSLSNVVLARVGR